MDVGYEYRWGGGRHSGLDAESTEWDKHSVSFRTLQSVILAEAGTLIRCLNMRMRRFIRDD